MSKRRAASRDSGFNESLWARRLVARRLRAEAGAAWRPAPADLHARTMARLDRAPRDAAPAPVGRGVLAYATAAGLLILVSVFAGLGRPAPSPTAAVSPAAPAVARGEGGVLPVIAIDPTPLRSALERRVERMDAPWRAPLMAEARLVLADAERATDAVLARLPGRPIRLSRSVLDDVDAAPPAGDHDEPARAFPWNRLELP